MIELMYSVMFLLLVFGMLAAICLAAVYLINYRDTKKEIYIVGAMVAGLFGITFMNVLIERIF